MDETKDDGVDGITTLLKRAVAETWPSLEKEWVDTAFSWFPKRFPDGDGFNIAWNLQFESAVEFLGWFDRNRDAIDRALSGAGMSRQEFAALWREVRTSRGESPPIESD